MLPSLVTLMIKERLELLETHVSLFWTTREVSYFGKGRIRRDAKDAHLREIWSALDAIRATEILPISSFPPLLRLAYGWQEIYVSLCCFCFDLFCISGQFYSDKPPGIIFGRAIAFCVVSLGGLYLEGLIFGILPEFRTALSSVVGTKWRLLKRNLTNQRTSRITPS